MQQCLWCSRSTGQSQDHRGHSRLWGPLQFICIRHALHLLGPNKSWENNFKGPQRPNLFLMQEIIYMLNHPAHFISSCLQFSRMQYTALLRFWFFHTNTCNIILIQTFSIYWITAGNNRKLITDLHRKCQCSVPKKINSYLFGCLNMDLRAQEFTDEQRIVCWLNQTTELLTNHQCKKNHPGLVRIEKKKSNICHRLKEHLWKSGWGLHLTRGHLRRDCRVTVNLRSNFKQKDLKARYSLSSRVRRSWGGLRGPSPGVVKHSTEV